MRPRRVLKFKFAKSDLALGESKKEKAGPCCLMVLERAVGHFLNSTPGVEPLKNGCHDHTKKGTALGGDEDESVDAAVKKGREGETRKMPTRRDGTWRRVNQKGREKKSDGK